MLQHALSVKNDVVHKTDEHTVRVVKHVKPAPTPHNPLATETVGYTLVMHQTAYPDSATPHYLPLNSPMTYECEDEAQVLNHLGIFHVSVFDGWETT